MRRKLIAIACALTAGTVASALPTPGFAQTADDDLRCLAAFAARVSGAKDDTTKQQATVGLIYFFGRIDGEAPNTDLQGKLEELGNTMTESDLTEALGPCAKRLGERGKVLMTVGNNLQKKAQ